MTNQKAAKDVLVPDFTISATGNTQRKLSAFTGKKIILFFYPKDNTPICTSEAKAFRDHYETFRKLDTVIFGVSRDSLASHDRFKTRLELPFELIADTNEELCNYFDVLKMKNFFGKKIRGIVRSTFLINEDRVLQEEWRKIKVSGHIDQVLRAVDGS